MILMQNTDSFEIVHQLKYIKKYAIEIFCNSEFNPQKIFDQFWHQSYLVFEKCSIEMWDLLFTFKIILYSKQNQRKLNL